MYIRCLSIFFCSLILILPYFSSHAYANDKEMNLYKERLDLYKKTSVMTHIPWYFLAAIDQYERNKTTALETEEKVISISFDPKQWFGLGNISLDDQLDTITFFHGFGKDGNGDQRADINDPEDVLFTMATFLAQHGITEEDIKIGIWQFYKQDLAVKTIMNHAKVFQHYQTTILTDRDFPLPLEANFSYRSTWGDGRGFGGNRIHEGTDIFANYGTPVKSTTYGVVELKGWNQFGGWRIGIRDIYNIYHYYAHLQDYAPDVKVGSIVKPGDILGTVGSSGYGPPGTAGKFPPHLHYGMYKHNGTNEWAFDPYPFLKRWEQQAKMAKD